MTENFPSTMQCPCNTRISACGSETYCYNIYAEIKTFRNFLAILSLKYQHYLSHIIVKENI